jgi:uncharacterized protein
MAQVPVIITLTPAQRALIRESSGKEVATLGIEPVETGAGWLYAAGEGKFWLLKQVDPESYAAAQRNHQPRIDSRYARFRVRVGASGIHRWGVFADEQIPARRHVIEYVGELVNPVESFRRLKGATRTYSFMLNEFWRIDGLVGGSGAEFINHSCDPNLRWRKYGEGVICHSVRSIAAGEELTLDYRFSEKAPNVPCLCGSPQCRGTINIARDGRSKSRIKSGIRGNADGTHRHGGQR